MIRHINISNNELRKKIRHREILMGGNSRLKIYGSLLCNSGKRMSKNNRVFFANAEEAVQLGFRPCGHCMRDAYQTWKNGFIQ